MKLFNVISALFFTVFMSAQTQLTKAQVESLPNTIENEFVKIYKKSNNWQEYKMVKRVAFINFQKRVLDSVSIIKKDILTKKETIKQQKETIFSLNEQITKLNEDLKNSSNAKDSISLFGMQLSKTVYNFILWTIIIVLLVGLFFFIFKYKRSNIITKGATKNLVEIEEEFEQHRKKTLEKEQKLRRQLHDEMNKNRGN